jgi:NADH:ubiquinone oxidoreductase subunit C
LLNYQSYLDLYINHFSSLFKRSKIFLIYFNELSLRVVKKNISNLLLFFKIDWLHLFSICIDIIAIDQPGKKYRFTVIYYLISIFYNARIQIFTQTTGLAGLETISLLYKSAN